jgi:hypothetical protein
MSSETSRIVVVLLNAMDNFTSLQVVYGSKHGDEQQDIAGCVNVAAGSAAVVCAGMLFDESLGEVPIVTLQGREGRKFTFRMTYNSNQGFLFTPLSHGPFFDYKQQPSGTEHTGDVPDAESSA